MGMLNMKKGLFTFGLTTLLTVGSVLTFSNQMQIAKAATAGDFTITGSNLSASDYSYDNHTLTIKSNKEMTISGTTTTDHIYISCSANLVFSDLSITANGGSTTSSAVVIKDNLNETVNIKISGKSNAIVSEYAGIQKNGNYGELILSSVNGASDKIKITCSGNDAAIGSSQNADAANITIESGTYDLLGGYEAAGIGGGKNGNANNIVIEGGSVTSISGGGGAGIGSGSNASEGANGIYIRGGEVTARQKPNSGTGANSGAAIGGGAASVGKNIEISDGTVKVYFVDTSSSRSGAGIGGGAGADGENITVSGGTVTIGDTLHGAYKNMRFFYGGAGIGGGNNGDGKNITISGGTVNVVGGYLAAGIGGGFSEPSVASEYPKKGFGRNIKITGGNITVRACMCDEGSFFGGAAIGDGGVSLNNSKKTDGLVGSDVTITGGTIYALGSAKAAGIGSRYRMHSSVYISGGSINAITGTTSTAGVGEAIGSGADALASTVAYSKEQNTKTVSLYTGTGSSGYTAGVKVNPTLKKNGSVYNDFGINDIFADKNGKIYLYLEDGVTVDYACPHTETTTKNAQNATCEDAGYTGDVYCNACNAVVKKGSTIVATGHNYATSWTTDAKNHWKKCINSGCTSKTSVTAHSFKTIVDKEPTEMSEGQQHDECEICHYKLTSVTISKLPHSGTKVAAKAATCTTVGNREYYVCQCKRYFEDEDCTKEISYAETVIEALGHNYDTKWSADALSHWHACLRSGCNSKGTLTAHTNKTIIDKNATETTDGLQHDQCTVCNYQQESVVIQKLSHTHTGTKVAAVAATCEKAGNKEYYKCTCGNLFADSSCTVSMTEAQTVTQALGHSYATVYTSDSSYHWMACQRSGCSSVSNKKSHSFYTVIDVKPTESNEGSQHEECSVCFYKKGSVSIAKLPHSGVKVEAKAPTCTENGNEEYYLCACKKMFSDAECTKEITQSSVTKPALGHDYSSNWSSDGRYHWKACQRSGCQVKSVVTNHTNTTIIDKAATETETGLQHDECSICHYKQESIVIPVKSHVHTPTMVYVKSATCESEGNISYYSCTCGNYFSDYYCTKPVTLAQVTTSALGHLYSTSWSSNSGTHWKMCTRSNCKSTAYEENHVNETVIDREATEDATGLRHEECRICHYKQPSETVAKIPHSHVGTRVYAKEATCLANGNIEYYKCKCGKLFSDTACTQVITQEETVVSKLGHLYANSYSYGTGYHWKVCTRNGCGSKTTSEGHSYKTIVDKEATESETGLKHRICTICNYEESPQIISKLSHVHSDGTKVEAVAATCENPGNKEHYVCRCGALFSDQKCTKQLLKSEVTLGKLGHDYATVYSKDENSHWKECSRSGCSSKYASGTHVIKTVIDQAATENTDGKKHDECSTCGYKYASVVIPKLTHKHTMSKMYGQQNATCIKDGYLAHYECSCGQKFSDSSCTVPVTQAEICLKATGHSFSDWAIFKKVTCTSDGQRYRKCTKCSKEEYETIEATGHIGETEMVNVKKETCIQEGYTGDVQCIACKTILSKGTSIPKTAHSYGEYVVQKAPTCLTAGEKVASCKQSGCSSKLVVSIPATGHDYEEKYSFGTKSHWRTCLQCGDKYNECEHALVTKIDQVATTTQNGLQHDECDTCGYKTNTVTIPMIKPQHTCSGTLVPASPASCGVVGNIAYYECSCGKHYKDSACTVQLTDAQLVVAAKTHNYSDWSTIISATCVSDGVEKSVCANCGDEKRRSISAYGHQFLAYSVKEQATCEVDGYKSAICSRANCKEESIITIPALGHMYSSSWSTNLSYHWHKCTRSGCTIKRDVDEHNFIMKIDVEPTTTQEGLQHEECMTCSYKKAAVSIPKLEAVHEHHFVRVQAVEATCETVGSIQYYRCDGCGLRQTQENGGTVIKSEEEIVIPARGHNYGAWSVITNATCISKGRERSVCSRCSSTKYRDIDRIDHNFGAYTVVVNATCMTQGQEVRTCKQSGCGEKETRMIEALGHDFDENSWNYDASTHWRRCKRTGCDKASMYGSHDMMVVIDKIATETSTGRQHDECSVCQYKTNSVEIPMIVAQHRHVGVLVKGTAATCYKQGSKDYYKCSCGMLFADSGCEEQIDKSDLTTPILEHQYGEWTTSRAATCTGSGEERCACSLCGRQQTRKLEALSHNMEETYTSDDNYHWIRCTRCGTVQNKVTHKWEGKQEVNADTETIYQYKQCTVCSKTTDKVASGKADHTFVFKAGKSEELCGETGCKDHYVCSNACCEGIYFRKNVSGQMVEVNWSDIEQPSKRTEHEFYENNKWVSDYLTHWKRCMYCDYRANEEEHQWKLTMDSEGELLDQCTVCERTREHVHDNVKIHEGITATCGKDGRKAYYECLICKKSFLDSECSKEIASAEDVLIKATQNHKFGNWTTVKSPTVDSEGSSKRVCSVCKKEETKSIDKLKATLPTTNQNTNDTKTNGVYKITKPGNVANGAATSGEVVYQKPATVTETVVIPEQVTIDGATYKVTAIEKGAFTNNNMVKSVVIGANVTEIAANTFSGCTKLKKVTIGKNVVKIGDKAFYKCSALTSVTIPAKVTTIGKSAFEGCKKLKKITIKSTKLKKVGKKAIKGIYKKAKIKVPKKQLVKYKKLFKKNTGFKKPMTIKK